MSTKRSLAAHRLGIACTIIYVLGSSDAPVADAQEVFYDDAEVVVAPGDPATKAVWGTQDRVTYTISGASFHAQTELDYVVHLGAAKWIVEPGGGWANASLTLPTGARVTAMELSGCDLAVYDGLKWQLQSGDDTGASVDLTPVLVTGMAETPGCTYFYHAIAPFKVDNHLNSYFVMAHVPDGGSAFDFSLTTVRIYYKLQVSPPPGSATFSDVPTGHRFFRYVEALAASGITGGCGSNRFCPGSPLTRGQMAVFLAKALGLHWPN